MGPVELAIIPEMVESIFVAFLGEIGFETTKLMSGSTF
jgi:hypothetical protein